jgi:sortase (surface protein transpeptidase)
VSSIEIVDATDNRLLADTDLPSVTLVTCYPFYYLGNAPQRFIVAASYEWPSDS